MNLSDILRLKFPNIDFIRQVIIEDNGNGPYIKQWDNELGEQPSEETLALWSDEISTVRELEIVHELRRNNYPALGDQLDALFKAMEAGILPKVDGFYDEIKKVKETFPKPPEN